MKPVEEVLESAEDLKKLENGKPVDVEKSIGDLLLAVVNLSNICEIDPEEALTRSCDRFIREFGCIEESAQKQGVSLEEALEKRNGEKDV